MTSNEKAETSVVDILREFERALDGDCSGVSNRILWHCVRKAAKWLLKQHGRKLTEKEAFAMRWDLCLCEYGHGHFFWQCDDIHYTFPGEGDGKHEGGCGTSASALAEARRLRTLAAVPSYELVPMRPAELMEIANMLEQGGRDD